MRPSTHSMRAALPPQQHWTSEGLTREVGMDEPSISLPRLTWDAWRAGRDGLRELLDSHGLANVAVERSSEPPTSGRSGKFRQIWAEPA
jgi:hypothetical protein